MECYTAVVTHKSELHRRTWMNLNEHTMLSSKSMTEKYMQHDFIKIKFKYRKTTVLRDSIHR